MRRGRLFIINAIIMTATSLFLRSIGVAMNVYLSNIIGAVGMGVFSLLMSIYSFAVTLATSGINLATTRLVAEEIARGREKSALAAMKKCLRYAMFFSILATVLLAICAPFISSTWLKNSISTLPIYALALSLAPLSISSVLSGYFTSVGRVTKSSSALVLEHILRFGFIIAMLSLRSPLSLDYACLSIVLGGALAEITACIFQYILYIMDKIRYRKAAKTVSNDLFSRMMQIAIPVALSSYLRSALNMFKQIIVPLQLEKSGASFQKSLADYGMIRAMVFPILMFPAAFFTAFNSLIIPELAHSNITNNHARIDRIMSRIFKTTMIFSVCVGGVMFTYASEISALIYKSDDIANYLKIFAPLVVFMYFDDIVDAILKGLGEQVHVVKINIYDTILGIALLYTLLPILGIQGYIYAIYATEIFNVILSVRRLMKVTNFKIQIIFWLIVPIIAIAIATTLTQILIEIAPLAIIFAVTLYISILYVTGSIVKEDFAV